jgi:hypothetical protein
MAVGTRFVDGRQTVVAFHAGVPSSANPVWVSMKGYNNITILITYKNATTVTGSAISLQQATSVAGANAKQLQFSDYFAVIGDSANVQPTQLEAVGGSFTTDATNSGTGYYIICLDSFMIDNNHGFNSVQVVIGNAVASTIEAVYFLGASPRYDAGFDSMVNPLVN